MKRYGNLFEKIVDYDNLYKAYKNARKNKAHYREVKMVDENPDYYIREIQKMLINKTYTTSEYEIYTITDKGKEREIYKLPFYPDRIVQWSIILQIEDVFLKHFIYNTFAAIPKKGTHKALKQLDKYIQSDRIGTQYCLKIDVKKFFPNIDKEILKKLLRKKFKDKDLLWLLDDIIDSCEDGVPIGNYTSQYFGNFYLSFMDHWLKEIKGVKYYIRYMDDIVILHHDKQFLHNLRKEIEEYLSTNLNLTLKENWQVFPTYIRGVDFVGYRHFGDYILLRKSTATTLKRKMRRILKKCQNGKMMSHNEWSSINSYKGWIMWCNGFNLTEKYIKPLLPYADEYYNKYVKRKKNKSENVKLERGNKELKINKFSDFGTHDNKLEGLKMNIKDVLDNIIIIKGYKIIDSKYSKPDEKRKTLILQFELYGKLHITFTNSKVLMEDIQKYEDKIPFETTIKSINNKYYSFT